MNNTTTQISKPEKDIEVSQAIEAGAMDLMSSAPAAADRNAAWDSIGPELRNRWRAMFQRALDASLETGLEIRRRQPNEKPVHKAIEDWLRQVVAHGEKIRAEESVISRRQALRVIYQFVENAQKALRENQQANPN